jgi:hypothetical protein
MAHHSKFFTAPHHFNPALRRAFRIRSNQLHIVSSFRQFEFDHNFVRVECPELTEKAFFPSVIPDCLPFILEYPGALDIVNGGRYKWSFTVHVE